MNIFRKSGHRPFAVVSCFPNIRGSAFSLVELLVTSVIFILILAVVLVMVNQTSRLWRSSNSRIDAFQEGRRAFETLTSLLSQATLNSYWGYDDASNPSAYIRKSELHFAVGPSGGGLPGSPGTGQGVFFQAPANKSKNTSYEKLGGLLNHCGFYVEFNSDADWLPVPPIRSALRNRYRLMFWVDDTESKAVFRDEADTSDTLGWIAPSKSTVFPLADNVIALVIWPRDEIQSSALNRYTYNSREKIDTLPQPETANQLPPVLQMAMVVIDENSAARLGDNLESTINGCLAGLFESNPRDELATDLKELERRLTARGIIYRVFSSAIPLYEAKWSAQ